MHYRVHIIIAPQQKCMYRHWIVFRPVPVMFWKYYAFKQCSSFVKNYAQKMWADCFIRMLVVFCGCSIRVFQSFLYIKHYIQPRNRIKTISLLTLKIQNGVICIMFPFSHCWHVYCIINENCGTMLFIYLGYSTVEFLVIWMKTRL